MPGATVTATNRQTQTATAVSDNTGFFTFPNLSAGPLRRLGRAAGLQEVPPPGRALDAAGSLTLDFTLETGAVTEEVTVTAESPVLQTDTRCARRSSRATSSSCRSRGRNPIGVVGLKPGVVGGSFNNYDFSDLGNGGFSINGSRTDENNITVDGATAIRTRSQGAIIGIQNVDALQEVQVLTGDYMPEYGRASGGQIRMVTKSGGNRFSGSGSFFIVTTRCRPTPGRATRARTRSRTAAPAPFDYKQYGYSIGGPVLKDKLFFFAAQEWVNYLAGETDTRRSRPTTMRNGDFSELLVAQQRSSRRRRSSAIR